MNANLPAALDFLIHDEGGWVQRKSGALGNMGLGMQALIDYHKLMNLPRPAVQDLKDLTSDDAKAIYTKLFAEKVGFDALPSGVDYAALDAACNEGAGQGTVEKPGAMRLLEMTKDIVDPLERVKAMSDIRLDRKRKRPDWNDQTIDGAFQKGHGEGWTNRIGTCVPARAAEMISPTQSAKSTEAPESDCTL
jgi:hypothetical protein